MKKSTLVLIMLLASSFSQAGKVLNCSAQIKSSNGSYFSPIMGHHSDSGIQANSAGNSLIISMNKEPGLSKIEHIFGLDAIKDALKIGATFNLKFKVVFEKTANGVTTRFAVKDQTNPDPYNNSQTYNSKDNKPFELGVSNQSGAYFNIFCKTE
ncbi:MAG: hypothetical protein J0M15_15700 [Deltaproteobacteria bacterium]|nr:hypothetical protein [Deltaproteobacteria bacterium]